MVHVSNAEGRRKMLAFAAQPESNLNSILINSESKKAAASAESASTSRRIATVNANNVLNSDSIPEDENSSAINIMMTPDITSSNLVQDPNCNVESSTGTTEMDNNNPDGFNANTTEISNETTSLRNTEPSDGTGVIRKKRDIPDKSSHDESDESEELERGDSYPEFGGLSSVPGTDVRKSPPKSKNRINSTSPVVNANISNESISPTHPTDDRVRQTKLTSTSKQVGLKRVSFGSSKGSMVETLVYENPVTEEHEITKAPVASTSEAEGSGTSKGEDQNDSMESTVSGGSTGGSRPPSRVRVTFFESEKPLAVSSPESDILDFDLSNMTLPGSPGAVDGTIPQYNRQMSGEVGWENPFRPDGDLSKEADQIVELIKEGKPINDETLRSKSPSVNEAMNSTSYSDYNASPKGTNGSAANGSGSVEVQRGVAGAQGGQVEHVVLKKKKGCCVIQ